MNYSYMSIYISGIKRQNKNEETHKRKGNKSNVR